MPTETNKPDHLLAKEHAEYTAHNSNLSRAYLDFSSRMERVKAILNSAGKFNVSDAIDDAMEVLNGA